MHLNSVFNPEQPLTVSLGAEINLAACVLCLAPKCSVRNVGQ